METLVTPHDEFFSFVLSDTENARDFILTSLPDSVVGLLDLESISVSRESFVDRELKKSQADVLIRTAVKGRPAFVYVLVEHKSGPERWTLFQLLKYMVRIWQKELNGRPAGGRSGPLPVIIPLIFYHGRNRWRSPLSFPEYFDAPEELASSIPVFTARLQDIGALPDDRIIGNILFRSAMQTLKYSFRGIEQHLEEILTLLSGYDADGRYRDFLTSFFRYILKAGNTENKEHLRSIVESIDLAEGRETFMTIAESYIREGIEKGIEKGKEEGLLEDKQFVLVRLLDKKFGLSNGEKNSILSCRAKEKLDRAIDSLLTAGKKTEVLAELQ